MTDSAPSRLRAHSFAAITHGFLPYLALQAGVLLLWWPKTSLLERTGTGDEPATLVAVVAVGGAALAGFALLMDIFPPRSPPPGGRPTAAPPLAEQAHATIGYAGTQLAQIGYLMLLCLPLTLVAHAISSLAAVELLWIAAFTAVHTVFYRVLGIWFVLRWPAREAVLKLGCPAVLVSVYALTTVFSPCLSHAALSYHATAPNSAPPVLHCGALFVGSYTVLAVLLCFDGLRLLRSRAQQTSDDVAAQP
ncbi:MAG: hypothetical protein AAF460_10175 [Pseudomonadota bacterium]